MKVASVIFPPDNFGVELSPGYTFQKFLRKFPNAIPLLYCGCRVWHVPGENPEEKGFMQFPPGDDSLLEEIEIARKGGIIKYGS